MPTYEYECRTCGHHFELKQGFHDKPQADCPECKSKAKRVFHPSPIIFKGSGFYVTDHRTGSDSSTSKNAPESNKAKPESGKKESDSSKKESQSGKRESESSKAKPETKKNAE
jgi:putative FmdB family regulatory protein